MGAAWNAATTASRSRPAPYHVAKTTSAAAGERDIPAPTVNQQVALGAGDPPGVSNQRFDVMAFRTERKVLILFKIVKNQPQTRLAEGISRDGVIQRIGNGDHVADRLGADRRNQQPPSILARHHNYFGETISHAPKIQRPAAGNNRVARAGITSRTPWTGTCPASGQ